MAVESVKPKWMGGVSVGEPSRAATIRQKEKNGRDKYKRQFTEPRLWEKTYLNSSRLPLFFNVFLYNLVGRHWVVSGLDRGTVRRFRKNPQDENNKQEKGREKNVGKKRWGKGRKNGKEKGKKREMFVKHQPKFRCNTSVLLLMLFSVNIKALAAWKVQKASVSKHFQNPQWDRKVKTDHELFHFQSLHMALHCFSRSCWSQREINVFSADRACMN